MEERKHTLEELRDEIDQIDVALLEMLNRRAKVVIEIQSLKQEFGTPTRAPSRERDILDRLARANTGPLSNEVIEKIYRIMFRHARDLRLLGRTASRSKPGKKRRGGKPHR